MATCQLVHRPLPLVRASFRANEKGNDALGGTRTNLKLSQRKMHFQKRLSTSAYLSRYRVGASLATDIDQRNELMIETRMNK